MAKIENKTDDNKPIELHSEEVQEIMGQIPSWILRWGITVIFILLIAFFTGSYFLRYPDILTAQIVVTTTPPPVELYAHSTGRINTISVVNKERVGQGDILAVIENTADYNDVEQVKELFLRWKQGLMSEKDLYRVITHRNWQVGDLQSAFWTFCKALHNCVQYKENREQYTMNFNSSTNALYIAIKTWEQNYIIKSPINGHVNLMGIWSVNQNVSIGDFLFCIIPETTSAPIGRAMLPSLGAGKVKPGQTVNVRLNNYPDTEFGFIVGRINSISEIPDKEGNYLIRIDFPKGLITNYNIKIPISQMTGTAQVIIKNKRLLEKFIQPLDKIFK
jgi:hypothetical protein